MEFGYWGIRGSGEKIRLLLAYLGVEYKEVNPTGEEWFGSQKAEHTKNGMPFVNMPYLVDGDFQITESNAIPVYIAGKANRPEIFGNTYQERARIAQTIGVLDDVAKALIPVIIGKEQKSSLEGENSTVNKKWAQFSEYLADKKFLHGDVVTFADLYFEAIVEIYQWVVEKTEIENEFSKYENLKELFTNIRNLDGVKEYLASDLAKRPMFPPYMVKI